MLHRLRLACLALAGAFVLLALMGTVHSCRDRARVHELVDDAIAESAAPSVKMRAAVRYIEENVGFGYEDDYYLLPLFRPLRPTALQVLRSKGDCAYRARALIAVLDTYDVSASKLAVYDDRGESVHAVARVETERGEYIVDMLYNIIHEDDAGAPLPLDDLRDPAVLAGSIARAAKSGNERAAGYPLDEYPLTDTRSINWTRSGAWRAAYGALGAVLGKERVDALPRPYIAEDPPLMVAFASGCAAVGLGLLAFVLGWIERRRATRDN